VPTTELNWLQPYERNIIDFFFRVWVCRLAMMVLTIYTHDQRAGVRIGRVGSEARRHLIRRLFVNSRCCQLVMFIRVMYLSMSSLALVNGLLARR
jgi:hypothetical protein